LLLPSGPHVLTAKAYGEDPSLGVVASGVATVTVVDNSTATVTLHVHDKTPPQRQQDIAPMIRSVSATKADVVLKEPILVGVDAVDLDGDTLSYAWSSDCPSSIFSHLNGATVSWASNTAGSCTLQVKVSSRNQSVQESVTVLVYSSSGGAGEGGVNLSGEYVPRPLMDSLRLSGSDTDQSVYRDIYGDYNTANFAPLTAGQQYSLDLRADFGLRPDIFEMGLDASCGTVVKHNESCDLHGYCYGRFTWTAPASGSACKLTGFASNDGLRDDFSVGVLVR